VPFGTTENSPGIHPWVGSGGAIQSRSDDRDVLSSLHDWSHIRQIPSVETLGYFLSWAKLTFPAGYRLQN
jgi:hypothetical protein